MEKTFTKTIKVNLKFPKEMEAKKFTKLLYNLQHESWKAKNFAIRKIYLYEKNKYEFELKNKKEYDVLSNYGFNTFSTYLENNMKKSMNSCLCDNISQTRQFVEKTYKTKIKDICCGNCSLPTFKKSSGIIIKNRNFKIKFENGEFIFTIKMINKKKQKELGIKYFTFKNKNLSDAKETILKKIIEGKYKQGMAQLQIKEDEKENRYNITLTMCFTFTKEITPINKDIIMGIDLGIVNTATFAIYNVDKKKYKQINIKNSIISGEELIHYRQKIFERRKKGLVSAKYRGEGSSGKGIKKRCSYANRYGDKIANYRDTYNHKISKYIVEFAFNNKCGKIVMEDLSKIADNKSNLFLKEWAYFDLQQKIIYKSQELGIEVIKINPKYTSLRCSKCGNIDKKNRDGEKNQAEFLCVKCGYKQNADLNAARNIAFPKIEKIIEEAIK